MKSKAFLILATISMLAVSISTVVLHTLYLPEHETLEVLRVEETDEGNNVLLRWFGAETDLGIFIAQKYSIWLPYMNEWNWVDTHWWANRTVSYGRVFNIILPHSSWAQIYYDEVELTLHHNGEMRNGTIF